MKDSKVKLQYSDILAIKLKNADEKKFYLRKAIYELDRLSYERGTRKGDYIIREKIKEINNELEIYDGKIRTCDTVTQSYMFSLKETLSFFEENYLDTFSVVMRLESLKQELKNQELADIEHNKKITDEKFGRKVKNSYRSELEKDISNFEDSVKNKLILNLSVFLLSINELFFIETINTFLKQAQKKYNIQEVDQDFANFVEAITNFIRIHSKIQKKKFTKEGITEIIISALNDAGLKNALLEFGHIDETKLNMIIINSTGELITDSESNATGYNKKTSPCPEKIEEDFFADSFEKVLNDLRYLKNYNITIIEKSDNIPDDSESVGIKKYLFYSPDTLNIGLKDIVDYLMDSLIFINEWLYIELKKNGDIFNTLKLLLACLPLEMRFYDFFMMANIVSARDHNKKITMWGELKQYVPKDIADDLKDITSLLSEELNDAFKRTIVEIELEKSPSLNKFGKKINIIYESYYNAYKKIIKGIKDL